MSYKAKCTKIRSIVECRYNTNKYPIVRENGEHYIEVPTVEEALLIEQMNNLQADLNHKHEKLIALTMERYLD